MVPMMRAVFATSLLLAQPVLGARLHKQDTIIEQERLIEAEAIASDAAKQSKCCCADGPCQMKGNSDDKKKNNVTMGDKQYCCKPRYAGAFASRAKCDKDKYKHDFTSDFARQQGKTYDVHTCKAIVNPTPEPTPSPTLAPTLSPTTPEPTSAPTPDPESLTDITDKFAPANKIIRRPRRQMEHHIIGESSYMCCCHNAGSIVRNNAGSEDPGIKCELVDTRSPKVYMTKSGCGGLMGYGWHSWTTMASMSKYNDFENVGKCVVPFKQAHWAEGTEPVAPTSEPTAEPTEAPTEEPTEDVVEGEDTEESTDQLTEDGEVEFVEAVDETPDEPTEEVVDETAGEEDEDVDLNASEEGQNNDEGSDDNH